MAVEEHDPGEPGGRERGGDVLDHGHERRDPEIDDTREADVRVRQPVVDRRRDERADTWRDPPGDLLRDEDVGQERAVRAVLLRRPGRDDDRLVVEEERLDLAVGHLTHEYGRRLHLEVLLAGQAMLVVSSPIPLDPDRGDVPGLQVAVRSEWPGEASRGSGGDEVAGSEHDVAC